MSSQRARIPLFVKKTTLPPTQVICHNPPMVKQNDPPKINTNNKKCPLLIKKEPRSTIIDGVTVLKSKKTIVKILPDAPKSDVHQPIPVLVQETVKIIDGVNVLKKNYKSGLQINFDDIKQDEAGDVTMPSDISNVNEFLQRMDPKGRCNKEDLIEKLETIKYELKKRISKCRDDEKILGEYKKVLDALSHIKEEDLEQKIMKNRADQTIIIEKFKKTKKKISDKEFERIIDLTAPKEERTPEPGYIIWDYSKNTKYKDAVYHKPNSERRQKFNKANIQKKIPSAMKEKITESLNGNLHSANIHKNHKDILQCKQYNPFEYKGLHIY